MGANAQTTVPTFTAGQVLTADQQNQSARTGVPVFAGTVERDAAFGGTGEKTLAEGQLCYLESTNVVQYYDGATWATVGPSTAGGLVFVTGTSFSGVTSVSLPNDTFSSTYRNYLIMLTVDSTTSASNITGRYRSSGSDISTSVYYQGSAGLGSGGATSNQANSASSSLTLGAVTGTATLPAYTIMLQFYAPRVSNRNKFASGFLGSIAGGVYSFRNIGFTVELAAAAAYDSFSIIGDAASALTGVYRVYGYADS